MTSSVKFRQSSHISDIRGLIDLIFSHKNLNCRKLTFMNQVKNRLGLTYNQGFSLGLVLSLSVLGGLVRWTEGDSGLLRSI